MPRLDPVSRAQNDDPFIETLYGLLFDDRDPVDDPGTATGTSGDWWTTFANDSAVFKHAVDGFGIYRNANIDPVLREYVQARVGYCSQSGFVFSQHSKALRSLGEPDDKIAAVPYYQSADCFSDTERLVMAFADCLVLDLGRVPEPLFDKLKAQFSDREILELTYIGAMYMMHGVMSRALRTEWDDVDERVTEVFVAGSDDASLRISADDA